jgi:hypothetical protein
VGAEERLSSQTAWVPICNRAGKNPSWRRGVSAPNKAVELTASSVRSSLASASGGSSPLAYPGQAARCRRHGCKGPRPGRGANGTPAQGLPHPPESAPRNQRFRLPSAHALSVAPCRAPPERTGDNRSCHCADVCGYGPHSEGLQLHSGLSAVCVLERVPRIFLVHVTIGPPMTASITAPHHCWSPASSSMLVRPRSGTTIISWGGDRIKGLPCVHSHHDTGAIRQQDAPEPEETTGPPSGLR